MQSSREPKPIEGFAYRAKFQNVSSKQLEIIFWEYEFTDAAVTPVVSRRQFLCAGLTKAGKEKEFKGFTLSGPSDVVAVDSLAKNTDSPLKERVVINRLEFTDGDLAEEGLAPQRREVKYSTGLEQSVGARHVQSAVNDHTFRVFAKYSNRATSDSPIMTVSPEFSVASVTRSLLGSFTKVPLRES